MPATAISTAVEPTHQEQTYLQQQPTYQAMKRLPQIWAKAAEQFGDTPALVNPHAEPELSITFQQLWDDIQRFAGGVQSLGIQPEAHVALFSENQPRWFIADQGIMAAGAIDVVRSSQAERDELLYILENSDATALVIEHRKALDKLKPHLTELPIDLVILLSDEDPLTDSDLRVVNFKQLMERGAEHSLQFVEQQADSLATLLYTSGTTGKPKGVKLTHRNLLHQVNTLSSIIQPRPGDRLLSILPTWHIYERTGEYFALSQGITLIYTDLRHFKGDLKQHQPQYFVSVPRLLEAVQDGVNKQIHQQSATRQRMAKAAFALSRRYVKNRRITQGLSLDHPSPSTLQQLQARTQTLALAPAHQLADRLVYKTIREGIGGRFKQIINGGGSLSLELDLFFEIIGVEVIVGYGLTETSPVLTARRPWHNLRGSAGKPIPGTEIRIADPETRETKFQGERGSVLARGPQIMAGYYKKDDATREAIDDERWFDTEDLGWLTPQQDLILTGRVKDTIVLSNGENVEPEPIEAACSRSDYIDQMVVVGQDQRSLGALIVPDLDALQAWAERQQVDLQLPEETSAEGRPTYSPGQPVCDLFRQELNREVKNRPGYSRNDRIGPFRLLLEPFSIENGMMTQTLKIKRHVVMTRYEDVINQMFAKE
jgi:long-chain acyl-CoA synthetase